MKIYMSIIKDSWMYQIAIFLTFSVCLSVFPAVTQLIQPIQKGECNYEENIYQIAAKLSAITATMQKNAFIRFFLILGEIKSEWEEIYFVPVCCFVLFNFADYLGKELATRLQWPKPTKTGQIIILSLSILRAGMIPLFMFCNVAPSNRSTKVHVYDFLNVTNRII